ncbi:MAG: cupin domain-containing protein [Gammaproteobacteria bacterium]
MQPANTYPHLLRQADIKSAEYTFSHPWNPKSEITGTHLSRTAGLSRTGVSLVRLATGKESFAYHLHHREEEWIYILSGRGVALIDGEEYELDPGDFVAFPTPSVPHNMTNPFDEELVYMMGGENLEHEIADFPTLGRRMVRMGDEVETYNLSDGKPLFENKSGSE